MHRKFNQFWYPILLRLPFEHFIIRHEFLYASLTFTSSTTKKSIFVHWKWMPIIQFKIKLYFFSLYRESYQFQTGKVVSMIFLGMNKLLNRKCFWQVVCCCCFMPFFFHYFCFQYFSRIQPNDIFKKNKQTYLLLPEVRTHNNNETRFLVIRFFFNCWF